MSLMPYAYIFYFEYFRLFTFQNFMVLETMLKCCKVKNMNFNENHSTQLCFTSITNVSAYKLLFLHSTVKAARWPRAPGQQPLA